MDKARFKIKKVFDIKVQEQCSIVVRENGISSQKEEMADHMFSQRRQKELTDYKSYKLSKAAFCGLLSSERHHLLKMT